MGDSPDLKMKNGRNLNADEGGAEIKEEPEDVNMDEAPEAFGPAALGLHRVGTKLPPKPAPTQPIQVLNARGMPARIRKKNRLFFDDDIVNAKPPRASPKRGPKASPIKTPSKLLTSNQKKRKVQVKFKQSKTKDHEDNNSESVLPVSTPDKKAGQKIGMRLRNLLKLPKAHKWVCYEWFYSNVDKTLFDGDNDFMICLNETFPQLKTRMLARVEWTKIRRMMGKPRRCSQAFFEEERKELEKKRMKIRFLQQRKHGDISNCKDLPNEIPLQLVLGTKVTARLRKPQDGLFTGCIGAVDTSNNTYRVTFDRPGLGTHSVPDFEVLSHESPETVTLSSIAQKFRPRASANFLGTGRSIFLGYSDSRCDPLLGSRNTPLKKPTPNFHEDTIGGYPVKLLELIVRLNKILTIKKSKIKMLSDMNTEAERHESFHDPLSDEFSKRYAGVVLGLERMNRDLHEFILEIQGYCHEIAPEPSVAAMLAPSYLREKCREEALKMVKYNNTDTPDKVNVTNSKCLNIITDLTSLMLQVKSLSDSEQNSYELNVLQGTMEEIKTKLSRNNLDTFANNVEIHLRHIQIGLAGNLQSSMPTRI